MNSSGSVLESQLRQRIILLEDSLARLASTRKELHDNVDVVKNEVRLSFSHQLTRLRHREQQILEKLDTVASVKDSILSQQQDQMHQALGACTQGLEWLQTAFEDVKTNRLTSIVTVEHRISDILNKLSSMEIMPRETAHVSYEADPVALRRAISSFGQVRSTSAPRHCESLPCGLEDYEDEDCAHTLLHKTVHGSTLPITTVTFGRPKLSTDHNDWLLKEALTSQPTRDPQQNYEPCESRCTVQNKRQDQVHNWLHQIKNLVENEPAVFDDFETIKKRLSAVNQCENIENVSFDVLFRPYFDTVLKSPAQQWLFGKNSDQTKETVVENFRSMNVENAEDLESCNSSFTFNSDTSFVRASDTTGTNANSGEKSFVDEYAEFWKQFLKKLWSTSDSMWLLPCASNQPPETVPSDDDISFGLDCEFVMAVDDCVTEKKKDFEKFIGSIDDNSFKASEWLLNESLPKNLANQHFGGGGTIEDRLSNVFNKTSLSDFPSKADCQQWLFRPDVANSIEEPSNCQPQEIHIYEDAVGWKSVLEKVHGLGDEKWLSSNQSCKSTNFLMSQSGYPPSASGI